MKADLLKIKWILNDSGLSRYQIHKATGIHQTTLANLVEGKSLIENLSFKNAAALTEYAEKIQDEMRGLNTLWYNDNGEYTKVYEVISDHRMGVDEILSFSGLTLERIAELMDFESADYECLTTEK